MLSNANFLAKFRFDTAENEPAENLQNFAKFADPNPLTPNKVPGRAGRGPGLPLRRGAGALGRSGARHRARREPPHRAPN